MAERHFIRAWRKAAGLSQEKLAELVSLRVQEFSLPSEASGYPSWGRTDVVKYEKGTRDPPLAFINGMAATLRCRAGDILNGPPPEKATPEDAELANLPPEERAVALRLWKVAHGG